MRRARAVPNVVAVTASRDEDAVDEMIRRRFRSCQTLPLFPEPPQLPRGFFQADDIGVQLHLLDAQPLPNLDASRGV